MKNILLLLVFLLVTASNIIAALFWWTDLSYILNKDQLTQRYDLPQGLQLAYFWKDDVSRKNDVVICVDSMGVGILYPGMQIPEKQTSVSKLIAYRIYNNKIFFTGLLHDNDTVDIYIDNNLSVNFFEHPAIPQAAGIDLTDKVLLDWLSYKEGYHPNFLAIYDDICVLHHLQYCFAVVVNKIY